MSFTKPSIEDLLGETTRLADRFRELRERYPDSLVFRYILSMHWRPDVGKTVTEPDVKAGIEYTAALGKYLGDLSRYFVDWMEKPKKFERFPLSRYIRWYKSMESVSSEQFLRFLKGHQDLLLIEQSRQPDHARAPAPVRSRSLMPKKVTRQNLPRLLMRARERMGDTQETAAQKCEANPATYKSWEQRRHFPGIENLKFAEAYIRSALSDDASNEN